MPDISARRLAGRTGGLARAATATSRTDITAAASAELWERYRDHVRTLLPDLDDDDAEIDRRAALLRKADLTRMRLKAQRARQLREQADRLERELDELEREREDGGDAA
jgi:hypothetical protein